MGRGAIVVDAGPLVLLAAGLPFAERLKATASYGSAGYRTLAAFLSGYNQLVVTPHALAEAWNLCGSDDLRNKVSQGVKLNLSFYIGTSVEIFTPATKLISDKHFLQLGISDVAQLFAAIGHKSPILTSDRKLAQIADARGVHSIHLDDLVAVSPVRGRTLKRTHKRR